MYQVKIFSETTIDDLEVKINAFIKDKNVVSIEYKTDYLPNGGWNCDALILYKEVIIKT